MRVSILTREYPPFIYGGAGVHVGQLVPQLEKFTDLVDVQCMGEPREGATAHAENYPADANGAIRTLGADVAMAAAIPEVDVVHAHTWYAQFAGIIASQFQDIPLVVTAHSLEPDRPWKVEQLAGGYRVSSRIEKPAYENADAVIAVSAAMIKNIQDAYPFVETERINVVKNGIDPQEFKPATTPTSSRAWASTAPSRSSPSWAASPARRASSTWSARPGRSTPTRRCCCWRARPTPP